METIRGNTVLMNLLSYHLNFTFINVNSDTDYDKVEYLVHIHNQKWINLISPPKIPNWNFWQLCSQRLCYWLFQLWPN